MYPYGGQQQPQYGSYGQQNLQQTGYMPQWPQQQGQNLSQQQQQPQQTTYQQGGYNQPLNNQATGWNQPNAAFQYQQSGGLMAQRTGGLPPMTSFQSQPTGGIQSQQPQQTAPLTSQVTGWNQQAPSMTFQSQPTGGFQQQQQQQQQQQTAPLTNQVTGWNQQAPPTSFQSQLAGGFQQQPQQQQQTAPLTNQVTGWNQQAPTTSFQSQLAGGFQQQPQQQQQTAPLTNQVTGWNQQAPLTSFQSQPTGGLMPQTTGFQSFQQPLTNQNTGYMPTTSFGMNLQPMQTGGQQPLTAQPTGFISSLKGSQNNAMDIPKIRLSFITARDQERFEAIFRSQVPATEKAMDSSTAKNILMKSNLSAVQLLNIWELADTNKSGSLMFPEFCVALHLANLARKGESLPRELPLKIKNEVTGFVDALNFDIGMKSNERESQQMANSFMQSAPMAQNLNNLQPQTTGYLQQAQQAAFQPQRTGLTPLAPQQTAGLVPMRTGGNVISSGFPQQQAGVFNQLFSQKTGGAPLLAQATGSAPPMTSFVAQQTGGLMQQPTSGLMQQPTSGLMQQPTSGLMPQMTGLQPMPTGRPGQWGFVATPTGGLPGLDMMQSHFMPNAQSQVNTLQTSMGGHNASNVTWAISKQEKGIYDNIFKQWDKNRKGYVEGEVAIDVFSKSGLSYSDLENIWTLADGGNKGKLNKDEFSVAMHLIYRRLNGLTIPTTLPPELIPPSSKLLENSVDSMKNKLKKQAAERSSNQSQTDKNKPTSGSFRNNDDDIQYVSKARRSRTINTATVDAFSNKLNVQDLEKQVREKKILLAAVDAEDEDIRADDVKQKVKNEIELLKTKIKNTQSLLNQSKSTGSIAEKKKLSSKLRNSSDKVSQLVSAITAINERIKSAKTELYRLKLEKENPTGFHIRGTGENGQVTEEDRVNAKGRIILSGMPASTLEAFEANDVKLNAEILKFTREAEKQKSSIKDIASSINSLIGEIDGSLNLTNLMTVGYQKWEQKDGVQNDEVKDFIDHLTPTNSAADSKPSDSSDVSRSRYLSSSSPTSVLSGSSSASVSSTYASNDFSYEERAKKIKEDAKRKMNERLAKLNIGKKSQIESTSTQGNTQKVSENSREVINEATPKKSSAPPPPPPPSHSRASDSTTTATTAKEEVTTEDSDSDSEDEEYKILLAKKKELEMRKQKKKLEKEQRLAKLKAEMAALEENDSDDGWDEPKPEEVNNSEIDSKVLEKTPAFAIVQNDTSNDAPSHSNNPFASMLPAKTQDKATEQSNGTHNPFSKPVAKLTTTPTGTLIDSSKLQAQRAAQMGANGGEKDWSDSGEEESDDEMPVGAKQAELASMLFGGSGQSTRASTFVPQEQKKEDLEQAERPKETNDVTPVPPPGVTDETTDDKISFPEPETETKPPVFPPPVPESQPKVSELLPAQEAVTENIPSSHEDLSTATDFASKPSLQVNGLPDELQSNNNSEFFDAASEASSFMASSPELEADGNNEEDVPALPSGLPPSPPSAPAPPITSAPPAPPIPSPPSLAPPVPPVGLPPAPPPIVPSFTGAPNISNLLGEINHGTLLKKVSSNEKHISDASVVGRVLD